MFSGSLRLAAGGGDVVRLEVTLRAFKGDIDRLASEVPAQLVALHPLQGLWL